MAMERTTRSVKNAASNKRLLHNTATRSHVIKSCRIPFGNGKSVNKERAITGLRKLAKYMGREELILNKNLYPTHTKRAANDAKTPNVFMGFDSDPFYARPQWLNFQPKHNGQNAPLIDNIFHQNSAGTLIFSTEKRAAEFVHLHESGHGRTRICTSQMCFLEYQAKESDKKHRQQQKSGENCKKRKLGTQNDEYENRPTERKRIKCHQQTFKALCAAWKINNDTRKQVLMRPLSFQDLPLDLKIIIWDFAMPPRTVVINPCVLSDPFGRKTLRIESNSTNHALFSVDHEARYTLMKHRSMLRITDTSDETSLMVDGEKDSVFLLAVGFLRTRSLPNYDKLSQPFSKIKTLSIPWTSAGFSEDHVSSLPTIFGSLKALTLLGFEDDISQADKLAQNWIMGGLPQDFQYTSEMTERKKWIENAFIKSGRNIEVQLMVLKDIKKEEKRIWERERQLRAH